MTALRTSRATCASCSDTFSPRYASRADRQDRAADRVGVMRAVLFGVGLAGAVHLQDAPGAARLLGRVHDFVDVLLGQRAGVPHVASGVPRPERPFPPGQQQLGHVRQAEEAEVPAGAHVVGGERRVGFAGRQSWQERFLEHQLPHPGPVEGGDGVGDRRAPVLADDAELLEPQVAGQCGDVTGHRGGVVAGQGALGAAGPSVVDRDDGVVRGQQRHDVAPVRHGLRRAVQQEHRLAGAADRVVDLHAVDLGLAVCEPDSRMVDEVHLGELLLLFGRFSRGGIPAPAPRTGRGGAGTSPGYPWLGPPRGRRMGSPRPPPGTTGPALPSVSPASQRSQMGSI